MNQLVHQLNEMNGLVQRVNNAVLLETMKEYLRRGDENSFQQRMQLLYGKSNDMKIWFNALYSNIAGTHSSQSPVTCPDSQVSESPVAGPSSTQAPPSVTICSSTQSSAGNPITQSAQSPPAVPDVVKFYRPLIYLHEKMLKPVKPPKQQEQQKQQQQQQQQNPSSSSIVEGMLMIKYLLINN
jgi:hypothetical protein